MITEDPRRAEARRLRVDPGLSLSDLMKRFGVGSTTLAGWLRGIAPPEWTRRPNAKDDLRRQAVELREQGWSVNDLAGRLAVAKSTAYAWVSHIPLDRGAERARQKREHAARAAAARRAERRAEAERREAEARARAVAALGELTERDVLFGGALVYLCAGARPVPWRRLDRLTFINDDARLHRLFLCFLAAHGRGSDSLRYRVRIHETADAEAAGSWWSQRLDVPRELFQRPVIRRHNPVTRRARPRPGQHGCLMITVPDSRELSWWVEGVMDAIEELR